MICRIDLISDSPSCEARCFKPGSLLPFVVAGMVEKYTYMYIYVVDFMRFGYLIACLQSLQNAESISVRDAQCNLDEQAPAAP